MYNTHKEGEMTAKEILKKALEEDEGNQRQDVCSRLGRLQGAITCALIHLDIWGEKEEDFERRPLCFTMKQPTTEPQA